MSEHRTANLRDRLWLWWKLRQLAPSAPVPHDRQINAGDLRRVRAARVIAGSAKATAMFPLMEAVLQRKIEIGLLENMAVGIAERHGAEVLEPLIAAMRAAATASDPGTAEKVMNAAWGALGKIPRQHVRDGLLPLLKDPEAQVRHMAAERLGHVGDAVAVEPLARALEDHDSSVREAAAWSLGTLGDSRAIPLLINVLDDPKAVRREDAVEKLGRAGKGDERVFQRLILELSATDAGVRARVARALGKTGDPRAVTGLRDALSDSRLDVRKAAVEALQEIKDPCAVEPLIRACLDGNRDLRLSALHTVVRRGGSNALIEAFASLGTDQWIERCNAAKLLAEQRHPRAEELLLPLAKRDVFESLHKYARDSVRDGLGKMRSPRAREAVREIREWEEAEERSRREQAEQRVIAMASKAQRMSDGEMVESLASLCRAYTEDAREVIDALEPLATAIGRRLNGRGGIREMRRIFAMLHDERGTRTLDMHWDGIGDWRG
jgi:HEAT repeat protein